jgi:acetylornithine/N-succinyldiaminopimelate aminotransferase
MSESEASRSESATLRKRFEAAMMPNYGIPPVAIARGEGCRVWDPDGNCYLDLIAGIAVSALGHAHPAIVSAVTRQVQTVAHTSNLFVHEPGVALAERLLGLLNADNGNAGGAKVFFCNSGTEANEAALKLVRRRQGTSKPVVAAIGSFHGRTMGSLSVTGKDSIREPFAPFGVNVRWIPYGDEGALAGAVDKDVAAVILEPTLGEGGVVPPPAGYLRAVRAACDEAGALFVLDEIQSGIGRTGAWFAYQEEGIVPDVLTLAKGLGGGLPIGACIGFGESATALGKGDHGSTFGGNPVSCAAALAVLDTIEKDGILDNVTAVGARLTAGIKAIDHPLLAGVRGSGLWLAVLLNDPEAPAVGTAAAARGFLVNPVQPDVLRLAPPLILSAAEADEFLAALPAILDDVAEATT